MANLPLCISWGLHRSNLQNASCPSFHLSPQQCFEYFRLLLIDEDLNSTGWRGLSPNHTTGSCRARIQTQHLCLTPESLVFLEHSSSGRTSYPCLSQKCCLEALCEMFRGSLRLLVKSPHTSFSFSPENLCLSGWLAPVKRTLTSLSRGVI